MAEDTTNNMLPMDSGDLLKRMKAIASDLWREPPEDVSAEPKTPQEKPKHRTFQPVPSDHKSHKRLAKDTAGKSKEKENSRLRKPQIKRKKLFQEKTFSKGGERNVKLVGS